MRKRVGKFLLPIGTATAAVSLIGAWVISHFFGATVILISPYDDDIVKVNKTLWTRDQPVPEIYGVAVSKPVRIVFPDSSRFVYPSEDTSLTLYRVDKQSGDNPLQEKTLWSMAYIVAVAGIIAGIAGALLIYLS